MTSQSVNLNRLPPLYVIIVFSKFSTLPSEHRFANLVWTSLPTLADLARSRLNVIRHDHVKSFIRNRVTCSTDCPQFTCVTPYVAEQPDELSIDVNDVMQVLKKTSDGGLFFSGGVLLVDEVYGWSGPGGWCHFPVTNLLSWSDCDDVDCDVAPLFEQMRRTTATVKLSATKY